MAPPRRGPGTQPGAVRGRGAGRRARPLDLRVQLLGVRRPGLGPEDPSDRFTYWPVRLSRGGPVLAPGTPDDLVQTVDVRDLAAWLVHAAETGLTGVYDGVGVPMRRADFLADVASGVREMPDLVWIDQSFLLGHHRSRHLRLVCPRRVPEPEVRAHRRR